MFVTLFPNWSLGNPDNPDVCYLSESRTLILHIQLVRFGNRILTLVLGSTPVPETYWNPIGKPIWETQFDYEQQNHTHRPLQAALRHSATSPILRAIR